MTPKNQTSFMHDPLLHGNIQKETDIEKYFLKFQGVA